MIRKQTPSKQKFIDRLKVISKKDPDAYGHFQFVDADVKYRIKIQKTSWRFETKTAVSWQRIYSQYYSKTNLDDVEKMLALRRLI